MLRSRLFLIGLVGVVAITATMLISMKPHQRLPTTKGNTMILDTVVVGPLGVNCFIVGCPESKEAMVVDPGAEPEKVLAAVQRHGLRVRYVVNTHGHFDHVGGNRAILEATGAKLLIHEGDVPFLSRAAAVASAYGSTAENSPPPDAFLREGELIDVGAITVAVLHTPGHTPGGCCLYLAKEHLLLTGDTLFAESVGRTDFPGSSHEALIAGIKEKLFPLPEETVVRPGHGPASTIGHEKRYNPYL